MNPLYLKKGEERRIQAGHLWIYSNEIDAARSPLLQYEPGQAVEVLGHRGHWLAHAYVNPHSLIAARITGRRRAAPLDRAELERRIVVAGAWRERLYATPYYRWVYGESDHLPGLIVDRYGAIAVAQINSAGMERWREAIVAALAATHGVTGVLLRCDGEQRGLEGLESYVEVAHGSVPDEIEIDENGICFVVPLATGQKTGWFFDQADNRRRAARLLAAGTVIDAFSYAGGWGVTAALAGAARVICVDSSQRALDYARRNAERNGVLARMEFVEADVAQALEELAAQPPVQAIVSDPPAFVKRKRDLGAGMAAYQRLNEQALRLLAGGGFLVSCSCSQHVGRDDFLWLVQKAARRAGRDLQLLCEGGQSVDHPVHPAMPETRYLKALVLRADSAV